MVVLLWILAGLLGLFTVATLVSWVWYVPSIVRVFGETPWLHPHIFPPIDGALDCEFSTADGLVLRGSYLKSKIQPRRGVIVFSHELGSDRWAAGGYAGNLVNRGFDIFTFDFRNHGCSGRMPEYQPVPWLTQYEVTDLQAAVNYACSRPDADPRGIGLFGVSRGGNAALFVAATEPRVRALVTDGAFPFDAMLRHYIRRFMKIYVHVPVIPDLLPDVCLTSYYAWAKYLLGMRRHCRFVNVERACRRVRQPVFMIHGERDMYIPPKMAEALRGSLSGRSKLWIVPGVKHNGAVASMEAEYHRRIWRFFQRHLAGSPGTAAAVTTRVWAPADSEQPGPAKAVAAARSGALGEVERGRWKVESGT
jgi:uncharacterized protein